MGQADYLALGDWNAVCFRCGKKFKASQLRKHWQGFYVCEADWEPRHPQDFVRAVNERIAPPWAQPEPKDVFIGSTGDILVLETSLPDDPAVLITEDSHPLISEN